MTSANELAALAPCPFCGEKRIFLNPPDKSAKSKGSINCPACLATMPGEVYDESELIGCWNTRATSTAGVREVQEETPLRKPESSGAEASVLSQAAVFVSWAMCEGPWYGGDLDGSSVQDKAEELGLIVKTTYDPNIHGPCDFGAEPGEDWFVLHPAIQAAAESQLSIYPTSVRDGSLCSEPLLHPTNSEWNAAVEVIVDPDAYFPKANETLDCAGEQPKPTAWLRDAGSFASDGQWDECLVPASKGDPGAFPVFCSLHRGEAQRSDGGVESRRHAATGNMPGAAPGEDQSSSASSFVRVNGPEDKALKPRAGVASGPSDTAPQDSGIAKPVLMQPKDCQFIKHGGCSYPHCECT